MSFEIFSVDPKGLAQILADKGKEFILYELWQNIRDEDVTEAEVYITKIPGRPAAIIEAIDNSPEGFRRISDAWTLFAPSYKKGDATKAGRFNLGEKLVIASSIAFGETTVIETTKGTVVFDKEGRHQIRPKRQVGTKVTTTVRMNQEEFEQVCEAAHCLIVPDHIKFKFNGEVIPTRSPVVVFEETLPTEVSDDEGNLRKTMRKTEIKVYEVVGDEKATIYELGIPIVATGDKFHVDISQKVPLNMNRDNVTPSYLRAVRTFVYNHTHDLVVGEGENTEKWVQEATEDERCTKEAVVHMKDERFGKDAVAYDPSDPEANNRCMGAGRTVIFGGSMSSGQWNNVRQSGSAPPAGKVSPTPKPYHEDGKPLNLIPEDKWTDGMHQVAKFAKTMALKTMDVGIAVDITSDITWRFRGTFGPGGPLVINRAKVGKKFFDEFPSNIDKVVDFLVHEFGHQYASNHLSEDYYDALTMIAGKFAKTMLFEGDNILIEIGAETPHSLGLV